ncbi:bifunctional (p)ppGpp synthetase/guanosine-3',5'-bis(diphosphate) 3'-pyrophosphohydrolase [Candidatus Poribacteria bacterium]|nr:bifunctional (p)ppGpp synthetase/guanosine-3',5'-bis(diphosphate) 3'-pyrophosphohydrolase [Candidatus Poribacteria bacterium]MYH81602.1 bifunctional (p)ppGpp synthetase/guanosine-3',5'-bis(diphosphate) 3'-pyrophosphohydrolase [Candidatus Poribacteria bacterium]MYK94695.1 bifunctional (p)ppGpp synthetase/guanosine-3',5'-bis(diphosphate) 3'-pyrophosphohydrolase [Candidatus Poribacteria bacterium]
MSVKSLIRQIQTYNPDADVELLERCYRFAQEAHEGQKRKSGEPYFTHCVKTAEILVGLHLDTHTICAGLMHDVLEDTGITREELQVRFGANIANLVEGVTKIGQYRPSVGSPTSNTPITVEDRVHRKRQAETYRKLLLATAEDMRVILIKLADRLHNMETLRFLTSEKCQRIAKETLEIYAPIAHRLGIWRIMSRLEDLAFKHLYPTEYRKIADLLNQKLTEREAYCDRMVKQIRQVLEKRGVYADVHGRTKHIYSIYQKMQQKGTPFSEIRDLVGLRVLVKTEPDCYTALGALHNQWNYHPDRLRDWIGQPKKNGYQSLHTTILDDGKPVEVQIRSYQMHKVAADGIAAHWSYKEGVPMSRQGRSIFASYKQILEDIQEIQDSPHQFVESMKLELFQDEVYVFSPKGDLFKLPAGATVIDFAYKIHTDIGHTCVGAEVNGSIAPIRRVLENGDQVNIRTQSNGKPSRSWLPHVKTAAARGKIRHWFREKDRADALELGKKFLEAELRAFYLNARDYLNSPELLNIAKQLKLKNLEELFVRIGNGDESAIQVVNLLKPEVPNPETETVEAVKPERKPESAAIQLENNIDLGMMRIMKCCNPIPGDQVVGYLTRGRGVSVHRAGCIRILDEPERLLVVKWLEKSMSENGDHPADVYPVKILVECSDRPGMLGEITTAIAQYKVNIRCGTFQPSTVHLDATAADNLTIDVTGAEQLDKVMEAIRQLKGVQRAIRLS